MEGISLFKNICTCVDPIHNNMGEEYIPLEKYRFTAILVDLLVHQRVGPHEVQHTVGQLPTEKIMLSLKDVKANCVVWGGGDTNLKCFGGTKCGLNSKILL